MRLIATDVAWQTGGRTIIEDICLTAEPGTFTGLLGPNGSGKTTLLNVLAGIRKPTAGRVLIDDNDLHRLPGRTRARDIALVEQQADTGLDLTVREVVELGRIPHRGRWPGAAPREDGIIADAMRASRVDHLHDHPWATLSGGERQRTQLARALAQQPRLLLLDEPTNHLDLGHQIDFLKTVKAFGLTTIAALHDLELAAAYCDRIVVLKDGRRRAHGPVDKVLSRALLADVYGVAGSVEPHRSMPRPHVTWDDVIAQGIHP